MDVLFASERAAALSGPEPQAAVDATGLEARRTSTYYRTRRKTRQKCWRSWPKLTVVCETHSHLWAGAVVTRGPNNDSPQFAEAVRQAARHLKFIRLLADGAYDAEAHHRLCRDELGMAGSIIPVNLRGRGAPRDGYRLQMHEDFPSLLYGQRWQVESSFSRNKRLLGSALRARGVKAQADECLIRVLTHNLMLLRLSQ